MLVGIITGICGVIVHLLTDVLFEAKYKAIFSVFYGSSSGAVGLAYLVSLVISISYGLGAAWCCWIEPCAIGSGIPDVKALLNGVQLNKFVRAEILPLKVIGMSFSVASGLPVGKEGPMIHVGAIVGAALSQGRTYLFGYDVSWTQNMELRNDQAKRDYITYGAAAGVAAAFSAPIGGFLFTLEEGASFWSNNVTFRCFFCAMWAQLIINFLSSKGFTEYDAAADLANSMYPFGDFSPKLVYRTYELFFFALVGIVGGLLGGLFNYTNAAITRFRGRNINAFLWKRILEVVLFCGVWETISFVMPLIFSKCTPNPVVLEIPGITPVMLLDRLVQWNCPAGYYNEVASLYMVKSNISMQQLFHLPLTTFSTTSMFVFFLPYFVFGALSSGILIPGGLFVPTLTAGAAIGRIIGLGLNFVLPGRVADPGTYSLICASAVLGGMSRFVIAGSIIILEACGNVQYLLPLMVAFSAARYTGNSITLPMYDLMMELKNYPFLEQELPNMGLLNYHSVSSAMAKNVVCLNTVNRVSHVYNLLKSKKHNGFPIVDSKGVLKGFVLRKTLCTLLKLKVISKPVLPGSTYINYWAQLKDRPIIPSGYAELTQNVTIAHDTIEKTYPAYAEIGDAILDSEDMESWLDLRNYMDPSPISISSKSSLTKAFNLFRQMGLRHLPVTDENHRVVGILTRHDLTEHKLEHDVNDATEKDINDYYSAMIEPALVPLSDVSASVQAALGRSPKIDLKSDLSNDRKSSFEIEVRSDAKIEPKKNA